MNYMNERACSFARMFKEKLIVWLRLDVMFAYISIRQLAKEVHLFNIFLDEGLEKIHDDASLDEYYERAKRTYYDVNKTLESIELGDGLKYTLIAQEHSKLKKINLELKDKLQVFEMMAGKESSASSMYYIGKSESGELYSEGFSAEKKVH